MTTHNVNELIDNLESSLREYLPQEEISSAAMIGIHSGGVWVANVLHTRLQLDEPLGTLDISFYRDDFSRVGMHPEVKPSNLPFDLEDRTIILVDDVLQTGRTIRAAMNEIFDYGRPAKVILVTLVERSGRELPVRADISATTIELSNNQQIKLTGPDPLELKVIEK
jgi:pyrimidine operon attenuation protein/uracil phosphoribosyltransferase